MNRTFWFVIVATAVTVSAWPEQQAPAKPTSQPEKLAIQKQDASTSQETAAPVPVETPDVATVSPMTSMKLDPLDSLGQTVVKGSLTTENQRSPFDEILASLDGWVKSIEVVSEAIPDPPENREDSPPAGEQESPELPGETIESEAPSPSGSVFGDIPTVKVMAVGPDNRYSRVEMEAWGVHIGGGRVATVPHITEPAQYGFRMQSLFVDGKPSRLYRHPNHKIDFGLASCEHFRDDNKYPPFRRAKYLERVTIHAMKSQRLMQGQVTITSPEWILSLDEDEAGVIQGDSGSPIVSESGELLGLVSGYKNLDDKSDHRVVAFVPIYELEMPGFAKAASAPALIPPNGVVDFTAGWCAPCRQMAPIVKRLAESGEPIQSIDVDQHPELMTEHRVNLIPTFIAFKDGKEVARLTGSTSEAQLQLLIEKAQ